MSRGDGTDSAADRIAELLSRALADLDAANDYNELTGLAYRLIQEQIRIGEVVRLLNRQTGTDVDGTALVQLAESYVESYLSESIFQQSLSVFEDFLFGLIGVWLTAYPRGLGGVDRDAGGSERTIPIGLVIEAPDKAAIMRAVVDRELDRLKYRRLSAWFEYLNRMAKLGVPGVEQIGDLAEAKASRDVLVHNRGVVNEVYLEKAAGRARYALGERLAITGPYLRRTWTLIRRVVEDLGAAATAKLG